MNIHYDQIGNAPECEQHRDQLETLMVKALAGDKAAEKLVVKCAAHFYGLVRSDFEDLVELIDAVRALDESLKFAFSAIH